MNEIPEKDNREVEIDMPDGSTWAVPLYVIANAYAHRPLGVMSEDNSDAAKQVQYWSAMQNPKLAIDRMSSMNWEDLAPYARLVRQGESYLYYTGLRHGAKRIVGA